MLLTSFGYRLSIKYSEITLLLVNLCNVCSTSTIGLRSRLAKTWQFIVCLAERSFANLCVVDWCCDTFLISLYKFSKVKQFYLEYLEQHITGKNTKSMFEILCLKWLKFYPYWQSVKYTASLFIVRQRQTKQYPQPERNAYYIVLTIKWCAYWIYNYDYYLLPACKLFTARVIYHKLTGNPQTSSFSVSSIAQNELLIIYRNPLNGLLFSDASLLRHSGLAAATIVELGRQSKLRTITSNVAEKDCGVDVWALTVITHCRFHNGTLYRPFHSTIIAALIYIEQL